MPKTPSVAPTAPSNGIEPPNCWRCRYFRITHLPATPYACELMGFQSRLMPHIEVLRADGRPCQGFMAKPAAPNLVPDRTDR